MNQIVTSWRYEKFTPMQNYKKEIHHTLQGIANQTQKLEINEMFKTISVEERNALSMVCMHHEPHYNCIEYIQLLEFHSDSGHNFLEI